MAPIKGTQSRTGGKLIRGGRTSDVTSEIDGTATEISGRREDNLTTLLTVSGGTKIESGNDRYHVFTTPGTFTTGIELTAEVLVVGGGGSGAGAAYGAGGGAGGVLHAPSTSIAKGRYAVAVSGQGYDGGWYNTGGDGDDSSFGDAIAKGGGGGTGYLNGPAVRRGPTAGTISRKGRAGGSSGGSGVAQPGSPVSPDPVLPQPAPSDYTPYGNLGGAGGDGTPPAGYCGGGGGGAGGVGTDAGSGNPGGPGGAGRAFPGFPAPVIAPAIPAPVRPGWTPVVGPTGIFAGGGGGGNYYTESPTTGSSGGTGGGGGGAPGASPNGAQAAGDAIRFTGSGGGGGNYPSYPLVSHGGKGADGIVIVKYSVA